MSVGESCRRGGACLRGCASELRRPPSAPRFEVRGKQYSPEEIGPGRWHVLCLAARAGRPASSRCGRRAATVLGGDDFDKRIVDWLRPRLAPRVQRPAVYAVRTQSSREWLEL